MRSKAKKNSLYFFIEDKISLLNAHFKMKHKVYETRQVFYISLKDALEIKSKEWMFAEHHLSVEKLIVSSSEHMTPSHYTLTLKHHSIPHKKCRIHVYFDENLKPKGTIQKKVFMQNDSVTLLETEEFSSSHPAQLLDLNLELTVRQLIQQAYDAQSILKDLLEQKFKLYAELQEKLLGHEALLSEKIILLSKQRMDSKLKHETILVCKQYLDCARLSNRYSDYEYNSVANYLEKLLLTLEQMEIDELTPEEEVPDLEEVLTEEQTAVLSPVKTIPMLSVETKSKIMSDIEKLLSIRHSKEISVIVEYAQLLSELKTELLILSFKFLKAKDRRFLFKRQQFLEEHDFSLELFFKTKVLEGDIAAVIYIDEIAILKLDLIGLYYELLEEIESNRGGEAKTSRLVEMANYFYATSDLYRSLVHFTATHKKTLYVLNSGGGEIHISILTRMYLANNLPAFKMYLEQMGGLELVHAGYQNVGFNALQAIGLLNEGKFEPLPFVNLLMEHGSTIKMNQKLLPIKVYGLEIRQTGLSSKSSPLSFFYQMSSSSKKIRYQKTDVCGERSKDLDMLIKELAVCHDMLEFYLRTNLVRDAKIILAISRYSDFKSILFNIISISMYNNCILALVPSKKPGIYFYHKDNEKEIFEESIELISSSWQKLKDSALDITLRTNIFVNCSSLIEYTAFFSAANGLVEKLEDLLSHMSIEDKKQFSLDLKRELCKYIATNPTIASEYFLSLLVLKSFQQNFTSKDYQELFSYAIHFSILKERILSTLCGARGNGVSILENIKNKLGLMLNLLDPKMHSEITDIALLRDIKAPTKSLKLPSCNK